jgi:hypothetical protein
MRGDLSLSDHEGMYGSRSIALLILNLRNRWGEKTKSSPGCFSSERVGRYLTVQQAVWAPEPV